MTGCRRPTLRRRFTHASRRAGVLLGTAALVLAACSSPKERPNVVLISLDCLNERQFEEALERGDVPELTRLSEEALIFTRGYSHAPWTTPAHMSLLSGLYPSQHGHDIPWGFMTSFAGGLDREPLYRTLPERLRAAGYDTAAFVGKGPMSGAFGFDRGFDVYHESARNDDDQSDLPAALDEIDTWLEHRSTKPFLLFLHTFDLHFPLARARPSTPESLAWVDRHLGALRSLLEGHGLYESALVFLTGDHGSEMISRRKRCSVHGAGHYEENLRVPFVLKRPGSRAGGRRDLLVRHVDLLPTVLDVAGLPRDDYAGPGVSILSRLDDRNAAPVVTYSEADGRCHMRHAVTDDRYKYIYTPDDPWQRILRDLPLFFDQRCQGRACATVPREELFDLRFDPYEERNLLDGELGEEEEAARQRLRAELLAHMNLPRAYHRGLRLDGDPAAGPAVDESLRDALRALGYIDEGS